MPRPDAVKIPETFKRGASSVQRGLSILDIADKLLEVDPSKGEKSHARRQPWGVNFVTRSPDCTLLYPTTHEKAGQPRYGWVSQPDGTELGYLLEQPEQQASVAVSTDSAEATATS